MRRQDVLVLVGTKAQFIKTAPVLIAMDKVGVKYRLVYTGQHSETFGELERAFGVAPAVDILVPGVEADTAPGLVGWACRFLVAAYSRIRKGEWRGFTAGVVHGDTASTLLSAIMLRLAGIPVAHVEAGLRSPRLWSPFPEELIRRLVSRATSVHFAPDQTAVNNLIGSSGEVIDTGGNTLADSLKLALDKCAASRSPPRGRERPYAIVSLHRSENLGSRARLNVLMEEVALASRTVRLKFVLHPVTRVKLARVGWLAKLESEPGMELVERTDYVTFIDWLGGARFLLTDGGSNQEEAAMLGIPTLLLRTETERQDGIDTGVVQVSGLDRQRIRDFVGSHASFAWEPALRLPVDSPSMAIAERLAKPIGKLVE
ncbi:MAG: hypothetical protein ABS41_07950 [Arenimonas sp. SCN 70-307]|uniref:UDP-N-acetylglucosamine 2-epimerase n=1 Tax=Arenimonas sp. SCN 70-307 TaxID=1660089 RepID=UPI0008683D4D|nr:UDP-N-acetylglucosamine 2-epimerase [Arenimonas sp. SCN 70-307]ODS63093.1 MAG: hypothetical protein ABS41_07950 [Arenimonas sp. SCN 70-307]